MNVKAPCATVQTTADNQGTHASMWTVRPAAPAPLPPSSPAVSS
jgi:hypothetical protein